MYLSTLEDDGGFIRSILGQDHPVNGSSLLFFSFTPTISHENLISQNPHVISKIPKE